MNTMTYYGLLVLISLLFMTAISFMSKAKTAKMGNTLSALAAVSAIAVTLIRHQLLSESIIWVGLIIGSAIGLIIAYKVIMIQMPQTVALLNGIGGASSAIISWIVIVNLSGTEIFSLITAVIAMAIGTITFSGSLVAAFKLHGVISSKPKAFTHHHILKIFPILVILLALLIALYHQSFVTLTIVVITCIGFGYLSALRVGGADMPILISILNSFSGMAGAIAGLALNNVLLIVVGGIIGSSGLILTQLMSRAMNRSVMSILAGTIHTGPSEKAKVNAKEQDPVNRQKGDETGAGKDAGSPLERACARLVSSKKVIIVPGYGMAISQAQGSIKTLADLLEEKGIEVKYAIHPVAGRMPGHMNVLLCEAGVSYEQLYEMDSINPEFADTDTVLVVGANDVINPVAKQSAGTPISGMPILDVDQARHVIICNFNTEPGYSGVDNPLYEINEHITILLGDAKETILSIIEKLSGMPGD